MRRSAFPVVAVACLLLAVPASAQDGAARLAADCQDDRIDGSYTQAEFEAGLRALPTDVDEYSGCREIIRSAQLRAAAAASGGGGAAGGAAGRPRAAAPSPEADAGAVAGARAASPGSGAGGGSGAVTGSAGAGSPPGSDSGSPGPAAQDPAPPVAPDAASGAAAGASPPPADPAGEAGAVGTAVTGVGRAATPSVTPPATARVLGLFGVVLLVALGGAFWMARRARA